MMHPVPHRSALLCPCWLPPWLVGSAWVRSGPGRGGEIVLVSRPGRCGGAGSYRVSLNGAVMLGCLACSAGGRGREVVATLTLHGKWASARCNPLAGPLSVSLRKVLVTTRKLHLLVHSFMTSSLSALASRVNADRILSLPLRSCRVADKSRVRSLPCWASLSLTSFTFFPSPRPCCHCASLFGSLAPSSLPRIMALTPAAVFLSHRSA
jgi:hypothetical protein